MTSRRDSHSAADEFVAACEAVLTGRYPKYSTELRRLRSGTWATTVMAVLPDQRRMGRRTAR
jgi:hypothetical protein